MKNIANIIFLEGFEPEHNKLSSFIGYLFPIIAVLESANLTAKILDLRTMPDRSLNGLKNELKSFNFDAIGISTNADNIRFVYKVCNEIKKEFPNVKIILGGPQVSFSDEKTLRECDCDIVIRHEGEIQLREVLLCLNQNHSYEHIKGISFRKGEQITRNESAPFIDLNTLPIPQYRILIDKGYWIIPKGITEEKFEDLLTKLRNGYIYFLTGRGCPNKCAFCVEGNIKNSFRYRSPDKVKEDLKYFLTITKAKYIAISDDTFACSTKRVTQLCEILEELQNFHSFFWFCEGRVDILSKHPELIGLMYRAGLRKLQIGLESGNQKVLDIYNKQITLEQIECVVRETTKYDNLSLHGNIILGNPYETLDEFKQGLNYIKQLLLISNFNLDISRSYLIPFVGTPIRDQPDKFKIDFLVEDFEFTRAGSTGIICQPHSLTKDELMSLNSITEFELMTFINDNIFKLPKDIIIKNCDPENRGNSQLPVAWRKSFGQLSTFNQYLKSIKRKTTIKSTDIKLDSCNSIAPLRVWNIEYDFINEYYFFTSLCGEKNILDKDKVFLWEKATGKKTINEIYEAGIITWPFLTLNYILDFYKDLEGKMSLIFIHF